MAQRIITDDGDVVKWDTVGKSVSGVFVDISDGQIFNGKQSYYAELEADNGRIKFPLTTGLERMMTKIKKGENITVTYLELIGKYKKFQIEVNE